MLSNNRVSALPAKLKINFLHFSFVFASSSELILICFLYDITLEFITLNQTLGKKLIMIIVENPYGNYGLSS